VAIIVFYTHIDKIIGLFVCSLIILFYQMNFIEGMENHLDSEIIDPETKLVNILDDEIYLPEAEVKKNWPKGISAYKLAEYKMDDEKDEDNQIHKEFRQENCQNGVLMYKNNKVKKDMAEFVFPELKRGDNNCNPCDKTCRFSIIETKLKTEKELTSKSRR
jgi:cytochrome c-type biogenesis protein CcmH/NrfF